MNDLFRKVYSLRYIDDFILDFIGLCKKAMETKIK